MKQALQSKTALDLAIELAQQLHHNDYGWIEAENQTKPNWITRTDHQLSTGELVREYLDIERLIGVGFGTTTKYAVIDLDWASQYHPAHDIDAYLKILHTLESIGLTRYVVIQSSHSRGLHIYIPLPRPVKTFELAAAIRVALIQAGCQPKNGQLEIFPNTKRYASVPGDYSHYNPHRMPLQPNSGSWLMEDDGLSPQPIADGLEGQLSAFLDQWEMAAQGQDLDLLARALPKLYETFKLSKRKYQPQSDEDKSVKAAKWFADLKLSIQIGWIDKGQTYSLLPKFLAYGVVFLKLKGEKLFKWMYKVITTAPGYQKYCQHQHEIEKIIKSWIKTNDRTQYYSPYSSKPDRNQPYPFGDPKLVKKAKRKTNPANKKTADIAIHQLRTAYACVRERLTPDTKIGDLREMMREQTKKIFNKSCSNNTLTKHKNIWHPDYNGENLTTLSENQEKAPEDRQPEQISSCIDSPLNESLETQTVIQSGSDHSKSPMIGCALEIQPNINIPTPPRKSHHLIVDTYNTTNTPQTPGKFEVLAGALSKIIKVAALVLNVGLAAGIGIVTPEPSVAVETSSTSNLLPTPTSTQEEEVETQSDSIAPTIAGEPLLPCHDPRISPMYFVRYNPNQIGVPWTTPGEFYKFLGYLVIVAKQDLTIQNPWAWAVKSIKNIKERGINSHWLTFTGQQMLDPNSLNAELLRQQFSPTHTVPANATIDRPKEPRSKIVERVRVETQPPKPEPTLSSPPDPKQIPTPRAYQPQQHTQDDPCPECSIATPTAELEQWKMCRFCAQKILWRRLI